MGFSWVVSLFFVVCSSQPNLRGVDPTKLDLYKEARFTCADKTLTLPLSFINDDYCDCLDGSDEPGTSACKRGMFFCQNKGFKSSFVPSSRVNDGFCDCCDGADEWKGRTQCQNNCLELGRESLKDLIEEAARQEAGVALKNAQVEASRAVRAEKEKQLAESNAKLTEQEAVLKTLDETKQAEEALEKAERDRRDGLKAATAAPVPGPADAPTPQTPAQEAAPVPEQHFPYPKEYQYTEEKKPEAAPESAFPYPSEYAFKEQAPAETAETDATPDGEAPAEGEPEQKDEPKPSTSEPEKEKPYVSDAAEAARNAWQQKDAEVRSLRTSRDAVQKELSHDFGAQDEYMGMLGKCFETQVRQYSYEICPYANSAQKEGGHSTSLGNWEGWEKKENGQLTMKFSGGQRCWQGPERSFNIEVVCGADNQLSNVDEPSKCVYAGRLYTPMACSSEKAKALREQLSILEGR